MPRKKKRDKKNLKRRKKFPFAVISLVILLIFIVIAFLFESGFVDSSLKNPFAEPQRFMIEDRCSLIVGQLIHTVESEATCELQCKSECKVRELQFERSFFEERESDCNFCECICQ